MTAIRVVDVRRLRTPEQRAGVVYVGRAFAGWPQSPLHNPFRVAAMQVDRVRQYECRSVEHALQCYREHLSNLPNLEEILAATWAATEQGSKPLGCWCIVATHGDGSPIECHAQIVAEMLHARFVQAEE